MTKQKKYMISLSLLLLYSSTQAFIAECAIAAGAALLGLGAFNYLQNEKPEKTLQESNKFIEQVKDTYQPIFNHIQTYINPDHSNPYNWYSLIDTIQEPVLYDMALIIRKSNVAMDTYSSSTQWYLQTARQKLAPIDKAISQILGNNVGLHYSDQQLMQNLRESSETIKFYIPRIEFLSKCLTEHKAFFHLFQVEDKMWQVYKAELEANRYHNNNTEYIISVLHRQVELQARTNTSRYPYLAYVSQLENNIYECNQALNNYRTNRYPDRLEWTQWVRDTLVYLKNTLVNEPRYQQELQLAQYNG